jgi:antitoxin component YwqK of YwqJK toxin-antitoxin module
MKKLVFFFALIILCQIGYSQILRDTSYYENGNKKEVLSFTPDGKFHGNCFTWSPEGVQTGKASYKNGVKDGTWKIWREDGSLSYEMHYKNGKKIGVWKQYDEEGKVIQEKAFS